MNLLLISDFIDKTFYAFDYSILNMLHNLAVATNGALTPVFNFISLFAEKGLFILLLSIVLMLFKKTRKVGICIFGAVCCGALITNIFLKNLIARPRPYMQVLSPFNSWWQYAGSILESDFSFPSGHTTATMAFAMAVFLTTNKKKSWVIFFTVLLMGLSRNYLMVHYPSDILGGVLVGFVSGIISYYITNLIFKILNKYDNKLFKFILNFNLLK